jgi:Zn-dependent protease with chaperone function
MSRPVKVLLLTIILVLPALAGAPLPATEPPAPGAPGTPIATAAPGTEEGRGSRLDVRAATAAYLARIPPEKKAKSDAYFEGGYWLQLWDFLYGAGILILVLHLGWSAAMRDLAERLAGRLKWLAPVFFWAQMLTVFTLLQSPLAIYEGYFREHQYGLATQTFGPWLGDQVKAFAVGLVMYGLLLTLLYAVLRRLRNWWVWGALVSILFLAIGNLIAPVYINPIFNKFTRLEDPAIQGPILSLARANGIPATDVWVMDASRQTTRVSANVTGLLGTTRITINDNMLKRCSLPEIEAAMGHEMGHYVLHHNYTGIAALGLIFLLGFIFLHVFYDRALRRFGARWRVAGIGDVAGLPLLMLLFMVYLLVMTPVINSVIRVHEAEADLFGLNASQQPDGAAEIALKLAEYRKMDPGELEEIVFFDHPSGRNRIEMAMRWKAEHGPGGPLAGQGGGAP